MSKRLAVMASGTGSLFEGALKRGITVDVLIVDRPCRALDIAERAGVRVATAYRTFDKGFDREGYTQSVLNILRNEKIDLVAMMGFMTVFSPLMFAEDAYHMRMLNTHPALLPSFKGAHAVRDALAYGVKVTGCTIHWATADLDAGPIVAQEPVMVKEDDTEASLHERIKIVERELYVRVLNTLLRS